MSLAAVESDTSSIVCRINGCRIEAIPTETIIEAADRAGIDIPALCRHPDLSNIGSCRMCMVQVDGSKWPVSACTTQVGKGMCIETETDELISHRRTLLQLLVDDTSFATERSDVLEKRADEQLSTAHDNDLFERLLDRYDVQPTSRARKEPRFERDADPNPVIAVDLNRCILCTRCVRACDEIQGRSVWGVAEKGSESRLIAGADSTMLDARCESCGLCAAVCPTGALSDRNMTGIEFAELPEPKTVRTTCGYCGVGCQFDLNVDEETNRVVNVTSSEDAPVNGMALCVKGRYGWDYIHHADRLKLPRVRRHLLDAAAIDGRSDWVDVDWDTALNLVAEKFAAIHEESGGDALAVLSSAKCSNEENYLMQKLARQVFGTNNVDHCARLCHSSTVAGLAMSFGSGAMSNSMDDVAEKSEAIFIIGSNTTEQHPVFGSMIRRAVRERGIPLVVADPRRIDITEFATLHIQQKPGTDVALINGLMHLILEAGLHDEEFIAARCDGFDEFCETVQRYTPDRVSEITGVSIPELREAARILGTHHPMAVIWSMGITQHTTGVLNVLSLANLQMLLGNMGVPGGGVNPLRGQNNVQGACDLGALPNVFSGYQPVADEAARGRFSEAWRLRDLDPDRTPAWSLSNRPGLTVTEIVEAAGTGEVRGLYILGENPVLSDPDSNRVREHLAMAEFIVLQDIFPTATSEYAHVLLPGVTFAERTGTFTNTERRVQLFRQAIKPLGEARADWMVISDLATRTIAAQGRESVGSNAAWDYQSSSDIMNEIAERTPSYAGVSYERLEEGERLQWPVADADSSGTPILHVDRFVRGKGLFHAVDHLPADELPDEDFPLLLTTGRVLYHWHGGEMTRRSRSLSALCPEPVVEISHDDAVRLKIAPEQKVQLESRRGRMTAIAEVTDRVPPGIVFANFHFPGEQNANVLTNAALDPTAKIPEYKVCAVRLRSAR